MKVYLAKSNRCNPIEYATVRKLIIDSGSSILEYSGGEYSHDNLKSSELLIVLPEVTNTPFNLGRGIYEQIKVASEQNIPVWIVVENAQYIPKVTQVTEKDFALLNDNNYINWAKFTQVPSNVKLLSSVLPSDLEIIL